MCRISLPPCLIITTAFGVCRIRSGSGVDNMLGMPAGRQDEPGWNAILPASISSVSFCINSLTHGFRLGLLRSPIRQAVPRPGVKGWPGSWRTGDGEPGTGWKPVPRGWTQPPSPPDKSGGCAGCPLALSTQASDRTMLPTIQSFDQPDRDIVAPLEVGMAVSRLRLAQRYPKRRDQPMPEPDSTRRRTLSLVLNLVVNWVSDQGARETEPRNHG